MSKLLAALVLGLVGLGVAVMPIQAESPWEIGRSHVELTIDDDGVVTAVERVDIDFGDHKSKTIRHTIPLKYTYNDKVSFTRISIESVKRNLVDEPYQIEWHNEYAELKIGDERLEIDGEQSYLITYTIEGLLRSGDSSDYLVWKGAGEWNVPIRQATASIELPVKELSSTDCHVQHVDGSVRDDGCRDVALSRGQGRFAALAELQPQASLVIVAEYERGAIPLTTVQPTQLSDWVAVYQKPLVVLVGISTISLLLAGGLWYARRKMLSAK